MRISDWSSDVCSSDLLHLTREGGDDAFHRRAVDAGAREGAVEVDDVEVRGARIGEKARLRRRIVAIDGGARHIALGEPHHLPAFEDDRGKGGQGGIYRYERTRINSRY